MPTSLCTRVFEVSGEPRAARVRQQIVRRGASEDFQQEGINATSLGRAQRGRRRRLRHIPPSRCRGRRRRRSRHRSDIDEVVVTGIRKSIQDSIGVKKDDSLDRRGGVGRGHRQAAGFVHRRIHRAPARHRRAAHQRPRADAVDPRPRPGLHRHHVQRPRAGVHQRQPHGRVRPVPVGAGDAGQDLQDARRRHGLPGHRGHHGHLDRASAARTAAASRPRLQARGERQEANIPGLPRCRRPRQSHLHRPVPRQHRGRGVRCRVQQDALPAADARALGLRGLADPVAAPR